MHFKKLELIGFKSFADKTVIEFPSGVTAIVGPNGCGKSNIADAMRWVLGEQSVKSLRGSDMQDIIFNGSSMKEPLNFTEVSLTLSNEAKILNIEYDEVTISRRLYRSGESEYLLNQNTVRLKDIQELLMGTGIGTDSYSIIEQGKMDAVLSARPEDRREIFEEAAGITKFKSKKKEALRKLEQTDANLLRVNDIIQEVKRQIGSIERQAKKAESYKKEFEKLKKLELWIASEEFLIFQGRKDSGEGKLTALKNEESKWASVIEEIQGRAHQQKEVLALLEEELKSAAFQEMTLAADSRKSQDRILLNRERVGELAAKKESLLKAVESFMARSIELAAEAELLRAQVSSGGEDPDAKLQEENLRAEEAVSAAMEAAIASARAQKNEEEKKLQQLQTESARLDREAAHRQAETDAVRSRLKKISHERDAYLSEVREADEALRATLFDFAGGPPDGPSGDFGSRMRRFKDKLLEFLGRLAGERRQSLSIDEESVLDEEIRSFTEDISSAKMKIADSQARREHLTASKKKAEDRMAALEAEARLLSEQEETLILKGSQTEAELTLLMEERQAIGAVSAALDEKLDGARLEREANLVSLTEARVKHTEYARRKERLENDLRRTLESRAQGEIQRAACEAEIVEAGAKREMLEEESLSLENTVRSCLAARDEVLKSSEGIKNRCQEAQASSAAVEKELDSKRAELDTLRRTMHDADMELVRAGFEMDRLKERIFNAYQVDLAERREREITDQDFMKELCGSEITDFEKIKELARAQREKLNKMGPVNLVAIEEFDEMRTRYEFLTHQEEDLLKAKDDLHKAILKINRTTRELFSETFEKIKGHFTEYYRLLFGGGTAELVLLDRENVLESGIEIIARPPGKKLQNISLLSGGEKALTSIALLFALFKVRPSPFCVLDEIDAPLDETNVERFCAVLRDFIDQSQFIAITHNKRTMHLADALYGITMAENGVSQVVSVKFGEKKTAPARGGSAEVMMAEN